MMIDIVTPTLWRSERLASYVANVHDTTRADHQVTFVVESHDTDTLNAVAELRATDPTVRVLINTRTASCLGAFNTAATQVTAPWWFGSGDDVRFTAGWDVPLLALAEHGYKVIGTNDLHNGLVIRGRTATHMLINTAYILEEGGTLDLGPGVACCEDYHHGFFDTELVEVAKHRGVWVPCLDSVVEHLHPAFGLATRDRTYEHGFAADGSEPWDRALWAQRRQLLDNPEC